MVRRLFCLAAFFLFAIAAVGQDQGAQPEQGVQDGAAGMRTAFQRAQHLKRGINASEWFAQSASDYSAERTDRYTDAADIALMAKLGFDNVRLSIDATPLEGWPYE